MKIEYTPTENETILKAAFDAAGKEIRFVGGFVRDTVLNKPSKDKDFCTPATPDEVMEIGRKSNFTVVPTGLQHGTVTLVVNHEPFEITTLRIDTDTDGRHATVEFTTDWKLDAERRDLTINALYMDFDGRIYDYFGGLADLEANRVQFVGDAGERIREDFLRILRYFRFVARFEADMDIATLDAIRENASGLETISKERVWAEVSKILVAPGRRDAYDQMRYAKVDTAIGLPRPEYHKAWVYDDLDKVWIHDDVDQPDDPVAALSIFISEDAEAFGRNWKLSVPEIKKLVWLVQHKTTTVDLVFVEDALTDGVPRDWVVSLAHSRSAFYVAYARLYQPKVFPVKGQDLLDRGYSQGREMGEVLQRARRAWVASRFTMTKEDLMEMV